MARGELGGGARPGLGQRPVEAEAVAEVDDVQVVEAEAGLQQPAREGVAAGALTVVEGGPRAAPGACGMVEAGHAADRTPGRAAGQDGQPEGGRSCARPS